MYVKSQHAPSTRDKGQFYTAHQKTTTIAHASSPKVCQLPQVIAPKVQPWEWSGKTLKAGVAKVRLYVVWLWLAALLVDLAL